MQAVVDPNEPPMPGKATTRQALHLAKALARGQKDAIKIIMLGIPIPEKLTAMV